MWHKRLRRGPGTGGCCHLPAPLIAQYHTYDHHHEEDLGIVAYKCYVDLLSLSPSGRPGLGPGVE